MIFCNFYSKKLCVCYAKYPCQTPKKAISLGKVVRHGTTFILDFLSPQFSKENDVGNNDKPDGIHVDSVSFQSV